MGTSTRNKGQSGYSPLVPSWLEGEEILSTADGPAAQAPKTVIPQDADPNRFRGPRTSFTNFINSGGRQEEGYRIILVVLLVEVRKQHNVWDQRVEALQDFIVS